MNENSSVVWFRQPDEIDDPLTNILRSGARQLLTQAVEMEAAALFTVAALKGVRGGCLLLVSDMVIDGSFTRISDAEMRAAVDRMTRIALAVAIGAKDPVKA